MNRITTTGLVLTRFNFGEADRIITVLTPDNGRLKLMVKGARRVKSKLAGGIEIFSINSLTLIKGRSEINTLTSSRLQGYFSNITADYNRTMAGYDILKTINKAIQDNCDAEYYFLLLQTLTSLNKQNLDVGLVKSWFLVRLLNLLGHSPNTKIDIDNKKLDKDSKYNFDFKEMGFLKSPAGIFDVRHIKVLRLLQDEKPEKLNIIDGLSSVLPDIEGLLANITKIYTQK